MSDYPCSDEKRDIALWRGKISSEDQKVDREAYGRNYDQIDWSVLIGEKTDNN